jgi:hypothetical protein
LKRQAGLKTLLRTSKSALYEMKDVLDYRLGFFINIDADRDWLELYTGPLFRDCLVGGRAGLEGRMVRHSLRCRQDVPG